MSILLFVLQLEQSVRFAQLLYKTVTILKIMCQTLLNQGSPHPHLLLHVQSESESEDLLAETPTVCKSIGQHWLHQHKADNKVN